MKNEIYSIWHKQLDSKNKLLETENIILNNGLVCSVGTFLETGTRIFQIQLEKSVLIDPNYLLKFYGVEVRKLETNPSHQSITILLNDNDLLDIFVMFIENLIIDLENSNSEHDVPNIVNQKIKNWARLFNKLNGNLLSLENQRGLYGELLILNKLIDNCQNPKLVLNLWNGPNGANQDFVNNLNALEVKTSKATSPSIVINNELQLDNTVLNNLFLCVIHLDEVANGNQTLEKIITDTKNKITDLTSLKLFEDKLELIGISSGDEISYNKHSFIIRSTNFYRVENDFPLINNSKINQPAIHHINYKIDVSAIDKFKIDFNILTTHLL